MLYVTESLLYLQISVLVIENQAAGYKLAHHEVCHIEAVE